MWLSKETANLPVDQIAAYHSLSSRLNFVVTGLRTAYGSWRYYQSGFGSYDAGGHRVLGWDDRSDRYNNFSEAMTQVLLVLNQAVKNASGESADVLNDALLSVQTLYVIWLANTSREEKLDQVSGDRYAARKKDGLSKSFDLFATELQKLEAIATEKFGSDELNKLKIEVFRKRSSEAYAATLEKVIIQIGQIRTSLDKYVEQQIAAAETPKSLAHVAQALPRPGGSGGGAG